jgi:hypothetical protein
VLLGNAGRREEEDQGRKSRPPIAKDFQLFTPMSGSIKTQKERIEFHEINQDPVSHGSVTGGTFSRRLGSNLGINHTASKEEA